MSAIGPGDWVEHFRPLINEASPFICADLNTGCWLWAGSVTGGGYGRAKIGGRAGRDYYAHRASYVAFVGPLAEGEVVRHRCDTPTCVNPAHLLAGSQADNILDAWTRGRMTIPPGKLTADQAKEIGRRYAAGERVQSIAKAFAVSPSTVSRLRPKADLIESLKTPAKREGVPA